MTTMKCVNHGAGAAPITADFSAIIAPLEMIARELEKSVAKELKIPFPEFINEIEVKPTPVHVNLPELAPVFAPRFEVAAPSVVNQILPAASQAVVNFDILGLIKAIYWLVGAIIGSALIIATAVFYTS